MEKGGILTVFVLCLLAAVYGVYQFSDRVINVGDVITRLNDVIRSPSDVNKDGKIPYFQDMSITPETSNLWPKGCPNERPLKPPRHYPQYGDYNPHTDLSPTTPDTSPPTRPACKSPRNRIIFIKTHKCSGSTLSSVILRYAYARKLRIAAPKFDSGHIGFPSPYRGKFVYGYWFAPKLNSFDVLAHHSRYDRCYMRGDFNPDFTIYTTILREPWSRFVSAVHYFKNGKFPPKTNPLRTILDNFKHYSQPVEWNFNRVYLGKAAFIGNTMAFDLGFPPHEASNRSQIDLFISRIDHDFDLVMIKEKLDESLVMLKRLMCWSMQDIFHLRLNKTPKHASETITEDMKAKHRKYSNVDYALYKHFLQKFTHKLESEPAYFHDEVKAFKELNKKINEFCNNLEIKKENFEKSITLEKREPFTKEIVFTGRDCAKLKLMPDDYTLLVWNRLAKSDAPFYKHKPWPFDE